MGNVLKRRLIRTWSVLFLSVWLSGMTASLMASACQKDRNNGQRKLRVCTISLTAGAWMPLVSARERARNSILHLERGIALWQLGRKTEAQAAFQQAYRNAQATPGP